MMTRGELNDGHIFENYRIRIFFLEKQGGLQGPLGLF